MNLLGGLFGRKQDPLGPVAKPPLRRGIYEAAEVESYMRDALALASSLAQDPSAIDSEARDLGYTHIHSVEVAAGETSHGFQQRLEDHRLIVNSVVYADAIRLTLHVHIPGKMPLEQIGRVRREAGFSGSEGVWEGTAYAHWKKKGLAAPLFVDVWIDNFEAARQPALTRLMIEIISGKE